MAREFYGTMDLGGTYIGRFDGRRAKLEIGGIYAIYPPNSYVFVITFTDLDRNVSFSNSGSALIQNTGPRRHFITDFSLWNSSGGRVDIRRLLLHTWDIDYISGESVWNNTEYGFYFVRQHGIAGTQDTAQAKEPELPGTTRSELPE